jgi:hypothetical protein
MTMRSIKACLAAAFAAILLIGSPAAPAAANDACNAGPSMCQGQTDTPFRLAADYAVTPRASAKSISSSSSSECRGKFGVALRKCQCEAGGKPGFPCRFMPAHPPVGESCSCQ